MWLKGRGRLEFGDLHGSRTFEEKNKQREEWPGECGYQNTRKGFFLVVLGFEFKDRQALYHLSHSTNSAW
jgi:hypothetical protein